MNIQLIIVLVILALALAFMGRKFLRAFRKKGCSCGEDCASCANAAGPSGNCNKIYKEIQPRK